MHTKHCSRNPPKVGIFVGISNRELSRKFKGMHGQTEHETTTSAVMLKGSVIEFIMRHPEMLSV